MTAEPGWPASRVTVSDDRRTYRVQLPEIVMERIEDCPRCGVELWSRNGDGRYASLGVVFDAPLLQPHYWPCTAEDLPEGLR